MRIPCYQDRWHWVMLYTVFQTCSAAPNLSCCYGFNVPTPNSCWHWVASIAVLGHRLFGGIVFHGMETLMDGLMLFLWEWASGHDTSSSLLSFAGNFLFLHLFSTMSGETWGPHQQLSTYSCLNRDFQKFEVFLKISKLPDLIYSFMATENELR
jgi:hypothetical protein